MGVFAGYDDVTIGQIVMAGDEATTNILRHGYEKTPGPLCYRAASRRRLADDPNY